MKTIKIILLFALFLFATACNKNDKELTLESTNNLESANNNN